MSYILDALKKSEQERSRGTIPDIQSFNQAPGPSQSPQSSKWPYIVGIILLLNIAVVGFWAYQQYFTPLSKNSSASGSEMVQSKPAAALNQNNNVVADVPKIAAASSPEKQPKSVAKSAKSIEQPTINDLSTTQEIAPQTQPKANVIFSDQPLKVTAEELKNAKNTQQAGVQTMPERLEIIEPTDAKVYSISELPDEVKRALPAINFAGHVFSNNENQSSVMLNGQKMREGQLLNRDLVLEEITAEGVILRYQNYRFKLGALQDWSFQ
ncbi:general secretion pathway protein GspB [Kaarinaea lacus]